MVVLSDDEGVQPQDTPPELYDQIAVLDQFPPAIEYSAAEMMLLLVNNIIKSVAKSPFFIPWVFLMSGIKIVVLL